MKNLKKKSLNDLFEKGKLFLEKIKPSDKILLVFHQDVDGYCSGAIFLKALEKIGKNGNVKYMPATNDELEDIIKDGSVKSYNNIIILDIDAPYLKKEFEKFPGEILIIDHHSIRGDLNEGKIVYINPRFGSEETYQPASYVVYKFLSQFIDIGEVEWIAVLGTVADFAFDDCKDLLSNYVNVNSKEELVSTEFWRVSNLLYSAIILEKENILGTILKYKNLQQLEKDEMLLSAEEEFDKEHEQVKAEFWKNVEEMDKIIISRIDPACKRIASSLATTISLDHRDKIVLVLEKRGEFFKISARYQDGKIHLGKLMEKCCISGGGHRPSAGGIIGIDDYEKFKKCVVSNMGA